MNNKKITEELQKQYPNRPVIAVPRANPTEMYVEAEPASEHPAYSIKITVIDASAAHVHHRSAQIYQVLKGSLTLVKNGRSNVLKEGEYDIVRPGEIHHAIGNETWVRIYSEPGVTKEDHVLMSGEAARPVLAFTQHRLLVSDMAKCVEFYSTTLGFEVGQKDEEHGFVELKTGDTILALFDRHAMVKALGITEESTTARQTAILTFTVADLKRTYNYVIHERKAPLIKDITEYTDWGFSAFHITDPEGNIIEINQHR